MSNRDLDDFFKKVGSEHNPHRVRVCNRVQAHRGLEPWTCEALVSSDPDIATLECVQCKRGMIICECECGPAGSDEFDICVSGNPYCLHQQGA